MFRKMKSILAVLVAIVFIMALGSIVTQYLTQDAIASSYYYDEYDGYCDACGSYDCYDS